MGRDNITYTDFVSTFRDYAERTNFPSEVVEMALSHASVTNTIRKGCSALLIR
jgi:hypothetical protein